MWRARLSGDRARSINLQCVHARSFGTQDTSDAWRGDHIADMDVLCHCHHLVPSPSAVLYCCNLIRANPRRRTSTRTSSCRRCRRRPSGAHIPSSCFPFCVNRILRRMLRRIQCIRRRPLRWWRRTHASASTSICVKRMASSPSVCILCLQLSKTDELVGIFPHQGGGRRWRRSCVFTCACKTTTPPLWTGIKFNLFYFFKIFFKSEISLKFL